MRNLLCAHITSCKGSLNINGYTVLFCSDESLLQEDSSLSADLSSNLHLRDAATGQAGGSASARSTRVQSHNFASSNPLQTSQRYRVLHCVNEFSSKQEPTSKTDL